MPYTPIYEPTESNDDLPWINEWLIENVLHSIAIENSYRLNELIPGPKGILILTTEFKAFAFNKSKLCLYFIEHLDRIHSGTMFIYSVGKQPALCVDYEAGDTVLLDLGKRYQQTLITDLPSTHPIRVEFETGKPPTKRNPKK